MAADNTINADVTLGGSEGTLLANRYRVVRPLGQGGMGSVWLAEDTQLDNRQVAIKMLPSILVSNKRAYNQLKAEALVSLKLTHPNIAAVRAFEENGGNPFLVVDYIDGITLDDYLLEKCDAGRAGAPRPPRPVGLPEAEVICLLTPIAAALDYAHSKGVVHRDVKPGNVMIAKDGTPYILDFGIAREIQETMTRVTGKFSSGTLMYMSPEQLDGDAPSAAQDVYSFAAMAYECLTGAPPFTRGAVEDQIRHKEPAPLAPHFMKCGAGVVAGLAKNSEDRPPNCAAVLAGGGGHGVTALPVADDDNGVGEDGRARTLREPRRWLVATAMFLAIVAVCGAGYVWYRWQQDALSKQARIARLAEEKKALEAEHAAAEMAAKRAREEHAAAEKREREARAAAAARKEKIAAEKACVAAEKASAVTDQKNRREADAIKEAERAASFDPMNIEASKLKADIQVKIDESARVARDKKDAVERNLMPVTARIVALPGGAELSLVWCPPGTFLMGSPRSESGRMEDETQHVVTIDKGFWMGKFPVTQRQWRSVMGFDPARFKGDDNPVESVSWEECREFCEKAGCGMRLPTEAEWEYACRAGATTAYPWGDTLPEDEDTLKKLNPHGQVRRNGLRHTAPVGSFESCRNRWGLYDMKGALYEWCADWYGDYAGSATDPLGPASGVRRVMRGNAFWMPKASTLCRFAKRFRGEPSARSEECGFRVCVDDERRPADRKEDDERLLAEVKQSRGAERTIVGCVPAELGIVRETMPFEARLRPYYVETGGRKYPSEGVSATAKSGDVRVWVENSSGGQIVVVGMRTRPTAAYSINIAHGAKSGRTFVSGANFNGNIKEVLVK